MQGGTFDPGAPLRPRRLKAVALALAGLLVALALIGGGMTGLGREVLSHDGWTAVDGAGDDSAVVLAPAERRPATPSAADGAASVLDDGAPHVLRPRDKSDEATPARTGGTAAPVERALPAEYTRPVVEQSPTDGSATGFRANIDTDRDGLTDVTEENLGTDALKRDSDGDELPDGWENRHGLDPKSTADADADKDGDGLRNSTEFKVKSDPRAQDTDANGHPDGEDDTDADGLPNGVEDDMAAGDATLADSDKDGVSDGAADQDGDGVPNAVEVTQGTDLATPDAPPAPPAPPAPEPAPAPAPAPAPPDSSPAAVATPADPAPQAAAPAQTSP